MLRLKELRNNLGVNQSEMARRLGMSRQTYSNYEAGRREPDMATLKLFAEYFCVSLDYLAGVTPDPLVDQNKKIPKDLRKILEDEEIILNGRMLSDDDKQKMLKIIEAAFWEAKELNKRK